MLKQTNQRNGRFVKRTLITAGLATLCAAALPVLASAAGFGNDNQGCPDDRPCFQGSSQSGSDVIFRFNGITGWDVYNVRYAKVGGGEEQVENRSGHFTIHHAGRNRVYTLKVQGCHKHTLGRSDCSPWVEDSVTTR